MLAGAPASVLASVDTDAALLRVPPSGTWDRRRADRCDIAPPGIVDAHGMDEPNALAWLVGRYLAAFGPASVADVASFAGTNVSPIKAVLDRLELRRFRTEDGGELLDVPGGTLPDGETPAPVRFLPTWDASLLVHARRSQVLPDRYRALVFHTKMPPSYPTFLVDGQVAGTWRWEDDEVQLNPFRRLTATERRAVDEEALRLASFHLHGA